MGVGIATEDVVSNKVLNERQRPARLVGGVDRPITMATNSLGRRCVVRIDNCMMKQQKHGHQDFSK